MAALSPPPSAPSPARLPPAEAPGAPLAPPAPRAEPEVGVRGGPAAARAAIGQVGVRPHPLHLALAHRAVAHERAQLALAAAPAALPDRPRIGWRAPCVALESAGITPRARLPLRAHALLAVGTHERGVGEVREGIARAAAPRAMRHRLRERTVTAVAPVSQLEPSSVRAAERLGRHRERRRLGLARPAAAPRRGLGMGVHLGEGVLQRVRELPRVRIALAGVE